jgi:chromosome partitioning protein
MSVYSDSTPKMPATLVAQMLGVTLQAIHKQLKIKGIQLPKLGNKSFITHSVAKELFNLDFKRKSMAFQIVKGGTGKTTAMHNISCAASLYGAKILCIDIDPQGNLTDSFNVNPENVPVMIDLIEEEASVETAIIKAEEGIDIIPSRIENVTLDSKLAISKAPLHNLFSNILEPVINNYDFIFIDCPPMMGHSVTAATLYADLVVIPLNPDKFSAKGLTILKAELKNLQKQYKKSIVYKVFLNKFSGNTILSDKAIQTTISRESDIGNALTTAVRQSQEIPNITDVGLNLFSGLKKSTAREDFNLLTRELLNINLVQMSKTRHKELSNAEY